MSDESCSLCSATLAPVIAESEYWRLILNHNQNLLGKCFLVLRRHLEAVSELTLGEWTDLHGQIARTTQALNAALAPDHFNYAFLQNQDRHVHLHIIPRYANSRIFAGVTFEDQDYPGHYAVPGSVRHLAPDQVEALVQRLQAAFAAVTT